MGRIFSVRTNHFDLKDVVTLTNPEPFILGWKNPTNLKEFLGDFIDDLKNLDPKNEDPGVIEGQTCTASLRCMICDGPMRSYLKRTRKCWLLLL